jgi:hypothetical protein
VIPCRFGLGQDLAADLGGKEFGEGQIWGVAAAEILDVSNSAALIRVSA